jgi:holliday junction DNA helicase RuvA
MIYLTWEHYTVLALKKQGILHMTDLPAGWWFSSYIFSFFLRLVYNESPMIRSLQGTIAAISENSLVVEVHNIGYLVHTPTARAQYLPDTTVFLHTYLVVRENALDLYGFLEPSELTFFELLLDVPKIGPKSALQILCQADVALLSTAILEQDPEHLSKLSGIGKKTAANLVSHLEGKIDHLTLPTHLATTPNSQLSSAQIDAIDALITLGYDPQEARSYVIKEDKTTDTKSLVQAVLKQIPIP